MGGISFFEKSILRTFDINELSTYVVFVTPSAGQKESTE